MTDLSTKELFDDLDDEQLIDFHGVVHVRLGERLQHINWLEKQLEIEQGAHHSDCVFYDKLTAECTRRRVFHIEIKRSD